MAQETVPGVAPATAPDADGETVSLYLARLFLPFDGAVLAADLSPENRSWLAAHCPGAAIMPVSREFLLAALRRCFGAAMIQEAVLGLALRQPQLSAQRVVTNGQAALLIWGTLLGAIVLAIAPLGLLRAVIVALSVAFVAGGVFRAALALIGARPVPPPAPTRLALPRYTVLVPLYREAAVLPELAAALRALDYPRSRLDILLAVEEDDTETAQAAAALDEFQIIKVPPGGPRTKPKAANYALQFARGDYLVVYDAEDRPEPDQLLKAVAAFRSLPRTVACVQARLNFYNAGRNWLTNGIMAQTPQERIPVAA